MFSLVCLRNVIKFGLMSLRSSVCPKRKVRRSGSFTLTSQAYLLKNTAGGRSFKRNNIEGKGGKKHSPRTYFEYVSVNFMSKKICLCINSTTYSTGKVFFRNIELFTVSSLLTYMSNCYEATLPLSFSFQSRTQSEINSTTKHTLP